MNTYSENKIKKSNNEIAFYLFRKIHSAIENNTPLPSYIIEDSNIFDINTLLAMYAVVDDVYDMNKKENAILESVSDFARDKIAPKLADIDPQEFGIQEKSRREYNNMINDELGEVIHYIMIGQQFQINQAWQTLGLDPKVFKTSCSYFIENVQNITKTNSMAK